MTEPPLDPQRQLADLLRGCRREAGLSGRALGAALGFDQSKISRIEAAKIKISEAEVDRWLTETEASIEARSVARALLDENVNTNRKSRKNVLNGWASKRGDFAGIEAEAASILIWQCLAVPELLQSTSYMRHFFRATGRDSKQHIAAQISACISRQKILYRPKSSIEVVIAEHVLQRRFGGGEVMIEQLSRITLLANRGLIDLSILPNDTDMDEIYESSVTIYLPSNDHAERLVVPTAREIGPESVRRHLDQFRAYQRHSLRGEQAIEFVEEIAAEMADGRSDLPNPAPRL